MATLYNAQRPQSPFTQQPDGLWLTPTGGMIGFDELRSYLLTGAPQSSAADVRELQGTLGLPQTGELDEDTLIAIGNLQGTFGLLQTGVPDAATMARARQLLASGGSTPKKKKEDYSGAILAAALVVVVMLIRE
ncbi:MAG: peptidoglycan-binding domain-containing protein [Pyrinomonadaceae bacterium]